MIGGISYFHTYAYDLLATNERIMAASCDAAIKAFSDGRLQKVTYLSSSMVFESADSWPSYEGQEREVPPPLSSYGFQKLAVEYFAQRRVRPVRPAVHDRAAVQLRRHRRGARARRGRGAERQREARDEPRRARPRAEGREGPGPAAHPRRRHQIRHYTYGGDLARGIVDRDGASRRAQRRLQPLDRAVDDRARAGRDDLAARSRATTCRSATCRDDAVRARRAEARARRSRRRSEVLGFEATTTLDDMLDEVIPWVLEAMEHGLI